jgi:dihydroxy-acid dehydratase
MRLGERVIWSDEAGAPARPAGDDAEPSPIALLRDGDVINIDLGARRLEVALTEAELAARRTAWKAPEPKHRSGWLGRYARLVTNASNGAVLT